MAARWLRPALALVVFLIAAQPVVSSEGRRLVDVVWLRRHLARLRLVDMASDPATYRQDHIPGAVYLHVDDARIPVAARLFFTLEVFGHEKVAILDGGLQAWRRAGLPLSQAVPKSPPSRRTGSSAS